MHAHRHGRVNALVSKLAADFLSRELNGLPLTTITGVLLSEDSGYATILFTAYPEEYEQQALAFLRRNGSNMRRYIGEHARMGRLPFLNFEIDHGEKNRQKIENLSVKMKLTETGKKEAATKTPRIRRKRKTRGRELRIKNV